MADNKKPKGYFDFVLAMDSETTGIALGSDDPSYNAKTGETYQAISWGFVVADAHTFKEIECLYVEIKWDGVSKWSMDAQKVHGISLEHLEEHGLDPEDAVVLIAELILKYWGPTSPVTILGHNAATFDLPFLKRLLRSQGLEIKFSYRHIDSFSTGFVVFETFDSNQLFEMAGLPIRNEHNALEDARHALQSMKVIRQLANECLK